MDLIFCEFCTSHISPVVSVTEELVQGQFPVEEVRVEVRCDESVTKCSTHIQILTSWLRAARRRDQRYN